MAADAQKIEDLTPKKCFDYCDGVPSGGVGLYNGDTCLCVSRVSSAFAPSDAKLCALPCSGNSLLSCGGQQSVLAYWKRLPTIWETDEEYLDLDMGSL
jgi:hypothetical protein